MSIPTIPEFAFPTERFWLSGYGENAEHLPPTIICKYNGKAYLAVESLMDFAPLIAAATPTEAAALEDALKDMKPSRTSNNVNVVDIDVLLKMRDAKMPLINKYLDHLEKMTE